MKISVDSGIMQKIKEEPTQFVHQTVSEYDKVKKEKSEWIKIDLDWKEHEQKEQIKQMAERKQRIMEMDKETEEIGKALKDLERIEHDIRTTYYGTLGRKQEKKVMPNVRIMDLIIPKELWTPSWPFLKKNEEIKKEVKEQVIVKNNELKNSYYAEALKIYDRKEWKIPQNDKRLIEKIKENKELKDSKELYKSNIEQIRSERKELIKEENRDIINISSMNDYFNWKLKRRNNTNNQSKIQEKSKIDIEHSNIIESKNERTKFESNSSCEYPKIKIFDNNPVQQQKINSHQKVQNSPIINLIFTNSPVPSPAVSQCSTPILVTSSPSQVTNISPALKLPSQTLPPIVLTSQLSFSNLTSSPLSENNKPSELKLPPQTLSSPAQKQNNVPIPLKASFVPQAPLANIVPPAPPTPLNLPPPPKPNSQSITPSISSSLKSLPKRSTSPPSPKTQPWTPEKSSSSFYQINGNGIFKISKEGKVNGSKVIDLGDIKMSGFIYTNKNAYLIGGATDLMLTNILNSVKIVDFEENTIL